MIMRRLSINQTISVECAILFSIFSLNMATMKPPSRSQLIVLTIWGTYRLISSFNSILIKNATHSNNPLIWKKLITKPSCRICSDSIISLVRLLA